MQALFWLVGSLCAAPATVVNPWSAAAAEGLRRLDATGLHDLDAGRGKPAGEAACRDLMAAAFRDHLAPRIAAPKGSGAAWVGCLRLGAEAAGSAFELCYEAPVVGGPVVEARIERLPLGWAVLLSRQHLPPGSIAVRSPRCLFTFAAAEPFLADYEPLPPPRRRSPAAGKGG